ncbi:MAG: type II toxin-antitoxin system mRNA interferase toxin, RelE/StbE family [Candidatus Paceibacterota bacterium]
MDVIFHKWFEKQYQKLSSKLQLRVDSRIRIFISDPFNAQLHNHPLAGKYIGYWSINITGDYRAIYYFLNDEAVKFVVIDTHSNLYE